MKITSSVAAGFGRYGMPPPACNPDVETGMRVASKVGWGNLPSKSGHARPLDSRIIRYVHDGRTDGRTKATLIASYPTVGGIIMRNSDGVLFTGASTVECSI